MPLFADSLGRSSMPTETSRRGELAKAMSDHVFSDENSHEGFAVVHVEGVSNEIRKDHGTPAPCPNRAFLPGVVHADDLAHQGLVNKRSLLNGSGQWLLPPLHNELV